MPSGKGTLDRMQSPAFRGIHSSVSIDALTGDKLSICVASKVMKDMKGVAPSLSVRVYHGRVLKHIFSTIFLIFWYIYLIFWKILLQFCKNIVASRSKISSRLCVQEGYLEKFLILGNSSF